METENKNNSWTSAAQAGLILGGISSAYLVLNHFTSLAANGNAGIALLISMANMLLWIGKFAACILAMKALMKKYALGVDGCTNSDTFSFGVKTALTSALVYSAVSLAFLLFVTPDSISEAFDIISQQYSGMLDSNSMEMLESLKSNMPQIVFFSNLIYCFLFGTVLSAILSRNIPSKNPFED